MSTVNEPRRAETVLTPPEIDWFRANAPRFLDFLKIQQTLISQLVIRVGGSGPGTEIPNLDELTADVEALTGQVDANESWLGGVNAAAYKRYEFPDFSQYDALLVNVGKFRSELAKLANKVDEIEANRMMLGQILANQRDLMRKFEELEAICLSSLAR